MKKQRKSPSDSYVKGLDGKQDQKKIHESLQRKGEANRMLYWQIKKQKYDKPNSTGKREKQGK